MFSVVKYLVVLSVSVAVSINANAFESKATNAMLVDENTGSILFEKNAQQQMVPSSMSKLMTLYVLFDQIKQGNVKLEDRFAVSKKSWQTGGSKMFLEVDKTVSVEELINGIAVQSGNDACIAVAEGVDNTEEKFVERMNLMAQQIGLKNSTFMNATGLPDVNHKMTSEDLVTLARKITNDFPEYTSYFSKDEYSYNNITQPNRNPLLGELGVNGLKTGHTDAGGFGVVLSAEQNGRKVYAVINGLKTDKEREIEARKLIDYAFNNFKQIKIAGANQSFATIPVKGGNYNLVNLVAKQEIALLVESATKPTVNAKVVVESFINAPIKSDQQIAILQVTINDKQYSYPLYADKVVNSNWVMGKLRALWYKF